MHDSELNLSLFIELLTISTPQQLITTSSNVEISLNWKKFDFTGLHPTGISDL